MLIDLILNENPGELATRYLKAMKTSLLMLLYLVSDILDMKASIMIQQRSYQFLFELLT